MTFVPGYGETPVPDDDLVALQPDLRVSLGDVVTRAEIYDIEQAIQGQVSQELLAAIDAGALGVDDLLADTFIREMHARLYGLVWAWAGVFRRRELNIGVAPEMIAVEVRASLDTIRHRWGHTSDWTPREFGIATHAELVRIHPFVDGNGRTTRLLADLLFYATQDGDPTQYDWILDKQRYIELLRQYDRHRDATDLAAFIETRAV